MSRDGTGGAALESPPAQAAAWKVAAPLTIAVLVVLLLLFWETVAFTVDFWSRRRAYGHGLLLVPISLFLIWQNRARLARLVPRPQPWAAPLLLGASLVWALARFVDVQLLMQLALLGVIASVLWTLLGNRAGRELAFPVGYLILGIPVWSLLTPVLQDYTAHAATNLLRVLDVPVHMEAFYISIPSGQFVVEEVCAGLRYLMATMSIAALFAYLNLRRARLGVLFFLACVAFSIVLNWLRVVTIIWVGHVSAMQHWLVKDHLSFGWVVFAVGLIPMFAFGIWLQRFDKAPVGAPSAGGAGTSPPARRFTTWGLIAFLLGGAGPAAVLWSASRAGPPQAVHLTLPAPTAPWQRVSDGEPDWRPNFIGTDAHVLAEYAGGDARVALYIAFYAIQREGSELVSELNMLHERARWKVRRSGEQRVTLSDAGTLRVREVELVAGSGDGRLIWFWYRVGGRRTVSVLEAKLLQLWASLGGAPEAAMVAVSAPMGERVEDTRSTLEEFLSAMEPAAAQAIEAAIPR